MFRFWLVVFVASIVWFDLSSADNSSPKFATNVTSIVPGQPFLARCDVGSFLPAKLDMDRVYSYNIYFTHSNGLIAYFEFNSWHQLEPNYHEYNLSDVRIIAHKFYNKSIFDLTLVLESNHAYYYLCKTEIDKEGDTIKKSSNKWTGKVASTKVQPPVVQISANVTEVVVNKPFAVECTITGFELKHSNYSVRLIRTNGLVLGTFDVYEPSNSNQSKPHVLFASHHQHDITVQPSSSDRFPHFHFILTSHSEINQNYWCVLEDHSTAISNQYKSAVWPGQVFQLVANVPELRNNTPFVVECDTFNFKLEEKSYTVQFNFGNETFAQYQIKPNQTNKFVVLDSTNLRGDITHGDRFECPVFRVEINANYLCDSCRFFCELVVDNSGRYISNYWP